jgi:thymidylate kinase
VNPEGGAGIVSPELAWAAYLLAGWWDPEGRELPAPGAPADAGQVAALLRSNSTPLLALAGDTRPAARALLADPAFAAALDEDAGRMAAQQAAFVGIQDAWAAQGIPALFVKALGPPPAFPYTSSNLDILVPRAREDEARRALRDLGYVELRHIEEPHKFLFRRYHAGQIAFDIHLHGRIEWLTEFVDAALWERSVAAPDTDLARLPSPEDGLLIALAHAVYENKAIKLVEMARVRYAARRLAVDWDEVAARAASRGWLQGLALGLKVVGLWEEALYGASALPEGVAARLDGMLGEDLARYAGSLRPALGRAPVRLSFARSKRLYYAKILSDPAMPWSQRIAEATAHTLHGTKLRLHLRSQRPMLVAFDGLDGSGKSVQAEMLAQALALADLRYRTVWARGGSTQALQPVVRLGRRLVGGSHSGPAPTSPDEAETAREARFARPAARRGWGWLVAGQLGLTYLVRVRWPLLRGDIVLADRYLASNLADLAVRTGSSDSVPARLLRRFAPDPDWWFWLDIPPAVAAARKNGDESLRYLEAQARALATVAPRLGAKRIDGAAPPDQSGDRIANLVLRDYLDRYGTLLNVLFASNPRPLPPGWRDDQAPGARPPAGGEQPDPGAP